ncbi:MAG: hypothetical protein OXC03_05660 [Flavobacteriaceae bacterium]|nr:hypothetical protein [Flavobacteriaceae bacterium]
MSVVVKTGMESIPAVEFSLYDSSWDVDFERCEPSVGFINKVLLDNKSSPVTDIHWEDNFDILTNAHKSEYYYSTGPFIVNDKSSNTNLWALENNVVSSLPFHYNLTSDQVISQLKSWNL